MEFNAWHVPMLAFGYAVWWCLYINDRVDAEYAQTTPMARKLRMLAFDVVNAGMSIMSALGTRSLSSAPTFFDRMSVEFSSKRDTIFGSMLISGGITGMHIVMLQACVMIDVAVLVASVMMAIVRAAFGK